MKSDAQKTPQALVQIIPAERGPLFHGELIVIDDAAQWLAWEGAKEAWLDSKRRRSGGENTVRAYRIAVRQFFDWSGVPPWSASPVLAQEWTGHLAARGLTEASINLKVAALSSLYDFVRRRYVASTPDGRTVSLWPADRANPFDAVERAKVSPYGRAKYPSTEELQAILAQINTNCLTGKRDFALLFTIAVTCRRSSEILNIAWGDVWELDDGNYGFRYRYKGGGERKGVIPRPAWQAIEVYLAADAGRLGEMVEGDFIFVPLYPERILRIRPNAETQPNRPISNRTANRILKKYARRTGVDLEKAHIHGLRHAGARLRVEQQKVRGGVDYMELMVLLGHSSLAVTQIYSQQVLEDPEDPGGELAAMALRLEVAGSR